MVNCVFINVIIEYSYYFTNKKAFLFYSKPSLNKFG